MCVWVKLLNVCLYCECALVFCLALYICHGLWCLEFIFHHGTRTSSYNLCMVHGLRRKAGVGVLQFVQVFHIGSCSTLASLDYLVSSRLSKEVIEGKEDAYGNDNADNFVILPPLFSNGFNQFIDARNVGGDVDHCTGDASEGITLLPQVRSNFVGLSQDSIGTLHGSRNGISLP
jgi:hypothetical protein